MCIYTNVHVHMLHLHALHCNSTAVCDVCVCVCVCVILQAVDQMMKMYDMFTKKDCTVLEINPLAVDSQKRCMYMYMYIYKHVHCIYT